MKDKIVNYIEIPNPGYGICMNGPWGSGKTSFANKNLGTLLSEQGMSLFYLIVNGVGSTSLTH